MSARPRNVCDINLLHHIRYHSHCSAPRFPYDSILQHHSLTIATCCAQCVARSVTTRVPGSSQWVPRSTSKVVTHSNLMATTEEIEEVRRRAQEAANVYERTLSEDGVDADVIQSLLGSTSHQNGDDHLARMRRTRSDDTVLHSDSRMKETKEQVPATTPTNPGQGPRSRGRLSSADHRDRDSFFALVSHHPSLDALRDQRSLGPPLGRQYYSPGELADEENQSQPSSPSSTTNSRQSPLHWLVKMGVSEHDGNVPISIRRPRKEERATSPSPKRGKLQSSAIFRRLRAATSEMALDKAEAERLKKVSGS